MTSARKAALEAEWRKLLDLQIAHVVKHPELEARLLAAHPHAQNQAYIKAQLRRFRTALRGVQPAQKRVMHYGAIATRASV
jgi:hypothetical protein